MKSRTLKIISLLLICAMIFAMAAGCAKQKKATGAADPDTPLVVAYSPFSGQFSPFSVGNDSDNDVVSMTQLNLLTTDRTGGIIYNAIEGETVDYNGTAYKYTGPADISVDYDEDKDQTLYTIQIRKDLKFSDGVPISADDIIFTYYVYLDPSYSGSTALNSYDIIGLDDYRTQTTHEIYTKYEQIALDIYHGNTEDYDAETVKSFQTILKQTWVEDCGSIVNYVMNNYLKYAPDYVNMTADEISADEGLKVMFAMVMYGYGWLNDDGSFSTFDDKKFTLEGDDKPTVEDCYHAAFAVYEGDPENYSEIEQVDNDDVLGTAVQRFIAEWGPKDESLAATGVKSISGITKVDDYTVTVLCNGYNAPAVYDICGIHVAPMHYYGDETQYDYENGQYGFPRGDLTAIAEKIADPLGAGAYELVRYEDGTVYLEANENYYLGCPLTKYIQFKTVDSDDLAADLNAGDFDVCELNGSRSLFDEIRGLNSNGELTGDAVKTCRVDNLGYGYMGLCASNVCVDGDPGSAESKALRTALATVFSVYRENSVKSYYGDAAEVIEYPISDTSWAAPQVTDEGYGEAFSTDADGYQIYNKNMSADERYEAAIAAALTWFEKAGFTVKDGKVVEGPGKVRKCSDGDRSYLSYEVIIPGDGTSDHPAYAMLTDAKATFESIGIEIRINDPEDSDTLWDALYTGSQDMWIADRVAVIDPDMYQEYHSSNIVGLGGSDLNFSHIRSDLLDRLIVEARQSDDQSFRKNAYKHCLDEIESWAVEIPIYQRQNCIVFSAERVNLDTVTPDITTFWSWMRDIEKLEMK